MRERSREEEKKRGRDACDVWGRAESREDANKIIIRG